MRVDYETPSHARIKMADQTLFPVGESKPKPDGPALAPRFKQAVRNQLEYVISDLDSLVALDHEVRTIWDFVEKADLSDLYAKIKAVEGHVGRSPIDPRILLALWLYATLNGIGSGRALEKSVGGGLALRRSRG